MGAAGWIAAATLAPLAGEVVVVVVVGVVGGVLGVLDWSPTTRAPKGEVVVGGGDEVGGVTALAPGPGSVVVVVAAGAGAVDPAW